MTLSGNTNAEKIWIFLKAKGFNDFACAGILGNLDAESGLNPKNLQDTYQIEFKVTDDSYTALIDNGVYSKESFSGDKAGYGLAQWTYESRKAALFDFAKTNNTSIGDLEMQINFFYKELNESFSSVLRELKNSQSVREASNLMLLEYEKPADRSVSMQDKRTSFSQKYYTQFVTSENVEGIKTMGYITSTKGQATKLSAHFNSTEFDCHGKGCCSSTKINETLVEYLEKIRNYFGKPITISSGYRCSIHNKNVGGATGSRHSKGDAADIIVKGVAPREVAKYAESIGILGIGLYETFKDGYFVHIDTRTKKSFWYGQAQEKRNTFGATSSETVKPSFNDVNTPITYIMLELGDSGAEVKELQENLIKLGYSCGSRGADGVFGSKTENAVMQFQAKNRIGVDGIAGNETQTAIKEALSKNVKKVMVTANVLNVRAGAGMSFKIVSAIRKDTIRELLDEKDGWGQISSPSGWISLQYTTTI